MDFECIRDWYYCNVCIQLFVWIIVNEKRCFNNIFTAVSSAEGSWCLDTAGAFALDPAAVLDPAAALDLAAGLVAGLAAAAVLSVCETSAAQFIS